MCIHRNGVTKLHHQLLIERLCRSAHSAAILPTFYHNTYIRTTPSSVGHHQLHRDLLVPPGSRCSDACGREAMIPAVCVCVCRAVSCVMLCCSHSSVKGGKFGFHCHSDKTSPHSAPHIHLASHPFLLLSCSASSRFAFVITFEADSEPRRCKEQVILARFSTR